MDEKMLARFWTKVEMRSTGECWPWTASRNSDGYGTFWADSKSVLAHRVAFFLEHGRWPEPGCLHRCDNPPCCNPRCLFEGDQLENMRDMTAKGRMRKAKGTGHPCATLSEADVRFVRSLRKKVTHAVLAHRFNVCVATISHIQNGRTWRHIL